MIPLTSQQEKIMAEFYAILPEKVVFSKKERNKIWKLSKNREKIKNLDSIKKVCPALYFQIKKSIETGKNIQSAVFSECVYAQTLANMFKLNHFVNFGDNTAFIPEKVYELIKSYSLTPRYVYSTDNKQKMLIQAGGCAGIDSALVFVSTMDIFTIEFKESKAKTSEPDLPKYKEDGQLLITTEFTNEYPQFKSMLFEQKDMNFFDMMGNNQHEFSPESIKNAVLNNYIDIKKYADVICTEDDDAKLVMMPVNQIDIWAKLEGEIRPAGRNPYKVWTPKALQKFLTENNAKINDSIVEISIDKLQIRRPRGGIQEVSGYKINPLFYVRKEHCDKSGNIIRFSLNDVYQLNPTIAAKMDFKGLKHKNVKDYYFPNNI